MVAGQHGGAGVKIALNQDLGAMKASPSRGACKQAIEPCHERLP